MHSLGGEELKIYISIENEQKVFVLMEKLPKLLFLYCTCNYGLYIFFFLYCIFATVDCTYFCYNKEPEPYYYICTYIYI